MVTSSPLYLLSVSMHVAYFIYNRYVQHTLRSHAASACRPFGTGNQRTVFQYMAHALSLVKRETVGMADFIVHQVVGGESLFRIKAVGTQEAGLQGGHVEVACLPGLVGWYHNALFIEGTVVGRRVQAVIGIGIYILRVFIESMV